MPRDYISKSIVNGAAVLQRRVDEYESRPRAPGESVVTLDSLLGGGDQSPPPSTSTATAADDPKIGQRCYDQIYEWALKNKLNMTKVAELTEILNEFLPFDLPSGDTITGPSLKDVHPVVKDITEIRYILEKIEIQNERILDELLPSPKEISFPIKKWSDDMAKGLVREN